MASVPAVHILVVVWGFLEILLFGGVIFGWHSLVYIFKDENYFNELCDVGNASYIHGDNNTNILWTTPSWRNGTENVSIYIQQSNISGVDGATSIRELSCDEKLHQASSGKSSQTCAPQDKQFNLIFTLSTVITGLLCILNGYLYDHFGTRFCRCLCIVCYIVSLICLIVASPDNPNVLYLGFVLQVYGGYIILVTNMQLAGLIPRFRSTVMSMCSGSYDSSAAVFLLFKVAHESGIKVNYCFAFQLCLFIIVIISTFLVHKKHRLPWPLPPNYRFRFALCKYLDNRKKENLNDQNTDLNWSLNENGSMINLSDCDHPSNTFLIEEKDLTELTEKENSAVSNSQSNGVKDVRYLPKEVPSILEILKTPLFLWNLEWMCFQRLRSWFFVGMFNTWMTRLACGEKALVSHYTSFFATVQFIGIFTSPLSGRLMDRKIPAAKIYNNPRYECLHASIASFVMCSSLTLIFTILVAIPVIELQYISCILHSLCRSFIYGPNFAFAANAYPIEHFGKVTGVVLTVSALFGLLQYPMFLLIQGPLNGNPLVVDIMFVVMILLSFGHPLYIWNFLRKERQKIENGK